MDDKKKRAFVQYNKWHHSLYNVNNVTAVEEHKLLMKHDKDYAIFCTKQGQSYNHSSKLEAANNQSYRQRNNSGRV